MRGARAFGALVGLTALVAAGAAAAGATTGVPPAAMDHVSDRLVCGPPAAGTTRCHAHVVTRGPNDPTPRVSSGPAGLRPENVKAAYGYTTSTVAGQGAVIGIVDAYDQPNIANDLAAFDTAFGLPCDNCFRKVDQRGGTAYPARNSGWGLEISLDVQWAHAIAPGAQIVLVEADSNGFNDLMAGVDRARSMGATYISMSWGSSEFSGETAFDAHFPNGASYFVSAGDNGLPAEYPSASNRVVSVGGTTLHYSGGVLTEETGWSGGGGGCSVYEGATTAQYPISNALCGLARATPDLSLDADPASGVSVYMTNYNGQTGWFTVGGTSAAAPMIAARAAIRGGAFDSAAVYGSSAPTYRDIISGNNGATCATGFELCTGRGSWADNGPISGGSVPAPTASIAKSCTGTSCNFTGSTNVSNPNFAWTSDGAGAKAGNPVTYTGYTAGSHTVRLVVTSTDTGATASSSITVSCTQKNKRTALSCK